VKRTTLCVLLLATCVLAAHALATERASVIVLRPDVADLTVGGLCGDCVEDCKDYLGGSVPCNPYWKGGYRKIDITPGEECDFTKQAGDCTQTGDGNCKVITICTDDQCQVGCSTEGHGTRHKCTLTH
jgi:hypothetical protein